ncbi:MAG TPA: wax ester/triacylglycerol synthase family O-acyltransferase [Acidimicrobiales bacterium]|nr:wax ester/triacylglycerol synthase family O-acyltransferase [Acidimicrobiales bacterium]
MPLNDSMFLLAERREQPMHVGGLQLFHYPPDAGPDFLPELYSQVIHTDDVAPLFRRRPYRPATSLGAWSWQEDPDIDLEHHIRHSALPRPGRVRELLALASRLHGTLLDRHRPLWEAHLIEGLEGNRFAVYSKIHHSLMDGVSALRLLAQTLSPDPDVRDMPMPWSTQPGRRPHPSPNGLAGLLDLPVSAVRTTLEIAGLGPIAGRAAVRALVESNAHLPSLAPRTILNQPITGARRFAAQAWPLERIRALTGPSGTTVNDVVLAMCGHALRQYLLELESLPDDPLVAMTPVSLRQAGSDVGGNAVGALLCNLATDLDDPAARLAAVHRSMEDGKEGLRSMTPTQVTVTSAIAMSPMVLAMLPGVRRLASPAFNVVISNIPGPTEPLYWNGARLEGIYPMSIPVEGQALNITVTSYNGNLEFGLTGCRSTVPHLQRLLVHLDAGLEALEKAVKG